MNWHTFHIWVRGWEDTFTAAGRTRAEARAWMAARLREFRRRLARRL